ncbi:hypothetical protein BX666DRAFT_1916034 [Dichotomocladium elegans]|nr:hypothetical protein BX666DRAFT_1916034 [Dichotomocladium elegans]
MFTPTDRDKKAFVERTRIERRRREQERAEKEKQAKQERAASTVQAWWRRHLRQQKALDASWAWWEEIYANRPYTEMNIDDCFRAIGFYCFLHRRSASVRSRGNSSGSGRLVSVCKLLMHKYRGIRNDVSQQQECFYYYYYALLVDARYCSAARQYLQEIICQCLARVCNTHKEELYLAGPELNLLLQYLNPKTYTIKQPLDTDHVLENSSNVLERTATQSILGDCLMPFNAREAFLMRVQKAAKLEKKKNPLMPDEAKLLKSIQLWLTTMVRIYLFPLEINRGSSDRLRRRAQLGCVCAAVLDIPLVTSMVNSMVIQHLENLVSVEDVLDLVKSDDDKLTESLQGNGYLFLMVNLIQLLRARSPVPVKTVVAVVNILGERARRYFSERQVSDYKHYHPLFKWSSATWGNGIELAVFERMLDHLEYLRSRAFMDLIFKDILEFDMKKYQRHMTHTVGKNDKLKTPSLFKTMHQESRTEYAALVEFSVDTEAIFAMYTTLCDMFPKYKMDIISRIAFTPRLIPQVWRAMNTFGPQGNMIIYLNAAKREDGDPDKEPLIKVLKIFCEASSLMFLTLDDTDIFEQEDPFTVQDLKDLSTFLNKFYFALLQHVNTPKQTSVVANMPSATNNSAVVMPASMRAFRAAHRVLLQIYDLDIRHPFCPPDHWLLVVDGSTIKSMSSSLLALFNPPPSSAEKNTKSTAFLDSFRQGDPVPLRILQLMPHTVPFRTRLTIFRDWIALDRAHVLRKGAIAIRIRRKHVLEDGLNGLGAIPDSAWKGTIRVTFINELGMEEAGIDHGGPFKDFVSLLVNDVFRPSMGLFSTTRSTNLSYPASTSSVHGDGHIRVFEFIGKVVGKAVYEGILLDVQFASFFLAKVLGRNVFLEELRELDEDIWRNLIFVKRYEGCVEDLGLYFATDEEAFGRVTTHELKYGGKNLPVTNENRVDYVYRMADYKLNQQIREQTQAFIRGFRAIIPEGWVKVFSPPELQRVISGEDKDFDVVDLRRHTEYQNGYFDQHPIIRSLWQIVEDFSSDEKRAFLKFVTSCPKPPLGGFSYLHPPFTIRMVTTDSDARQGSVEGLALVKTFFKVGSGSASKSGRLPTSSTCFNLLKLPVYTKKSVLREKLRYAIFSNAGFELS